MNATPTAGDAGELVEVRLEGLPVAVHQRAAEHSADVMREFTHLLEGPDSSHAPARLITLNRQIAERYSGFTQAAVIELDDAIARGQSTMDLVFAVPPHVADATRQLSALWDEVDRYCEAGEYLLALKTPPLALAYRRWFFGEFERQVAGEPPVPWREVAPLT